MKANFTCPECKHKQKVEIPKNACLWCVVCDGCRKLIKAPKNKCCIICAYCDVKCKCND